MNESGNHGPNSDPIATANGAPDAQKPEVSARSAALSEKVRSLRLGDKIAKSEQAGAASGLVWVLFMLVLVLAGAVAYNVHSTRSALKRIEELDKKTASAPKRISDDPLAEGEPTHIESTERKGDIALQYKGFVVPIAQILVSPEVGGKVVWLKFQEGQNVKKGDVLAKIEDINYRADYDKAKAALDGALARERILSKYRNEEIGQAKAELDDALATLEQTEAEFKRNEALRVSRAATERDFEEAKARYDSARARVQRLKLAHQLLQWGKGPRDEQIAAAKAEIDSARAQLVIAKKSLDDTIILAPVDGTILTKKAEENNQVNPAAFSNGLSASLCEMADLTELEIDVSIVERDRARVKQNQECRIRVDAWPGKVYEGYVSRIMPQADRSKNAIPVRVKIVKKRLEQDRSEGGPFILPEMSAVVSFLNRQVDPREFEK